jgi:quercetin dioxygenase-like cupin family protein
MSYPAGTTSTRDTSAETPPSEVVIHGRSGAASIYGPKALGTFTGGDVWLDPVLMRKDITVVHVSFQPCARTNWHRHEGGQLLKITAGSGWVCDQGAEPRKVEVGDIIWCPPGGVHWHGADDKSFLVHEATSFGAINWYEPVSDEDYTARKNE